MIIVAGQWLWKAVSSAANRPSDRQTVCLREPVYRNLPQLIRREWEEAITPTGLTPDSGVVIAPASVGFPPERVFMARANHG
jgi:hypothetical protein